ncbi:hypothetical protein MBOU_57710 [Mycobacterium bourgelatii]|uniref:Uncharacterized protein n=1 Tax=Mycobacterium bourgelatii TaxID=1273442 RepID=A0A7I9YYB6_MYCBU|nr:hypothetical protein MBOU_57710 [Mycobacterium bourgelatii]
MQMTVLPTHRRLQHDMQLIEHEIARQDQTTPNRRLGVHQVHPDPETPHTLRHSPHLGRWLIEHSREHIPASTGNQLLQHRQVHNAPRHPALPLKLPLLLRHAPSQPDTPITGRKQLTVLHPQLRRALKPGK